MAEYDFEKMLRLANEPERMTAVPWVAEKESHVGAFRVSSASGYILASFDGLDPDDNYRLARLVADSVNLAAERAAESPVRAKPGPLDPNGRRALGALLESHLEGPVHIEPIDRGIRAALTWLAERLKEGQRI